MATYLYAYHGGAMAETEEEQQAVMAAWGAWYEELGTSIVDGGAPSARTRTVSSDGAITDGGGSNPVTGYTVVSASNLDEAVAKAEGCPIRDAGGSVEVVELLEM